MVVVAYWPIRRMSGTGGGIVWLLLASYVFYLVGDWRYFWLVGTSIGLNFVFARAIASVDVEWRRTFLTAAIAVDLGVLGYFKYAEFIARQVGVSLPPIDLPIGVSFYTFTQIAFLVDVYRGAACERSPVAYRSVCHLFPSPDRRSDPPPCRNAAAIPQTGAKLDEDVISGHRDVNYRLGQESSTG